MQSIFWTSRNYARHHIVFIMINTIFQQTEMVQIGIDLLYAGSLVKSPMQNF